MKPKASEIADYLELTLLGQDKTVSAPGDIANPENGKIFYLKSCDQDLLDKLSDFEALVLVPDHCEAGNLGCVIKVSNPKLAFARVVNHFFVPKIPSVISKDATISSKSIIGKHVGIGVGCIIEEDVSIGDNTEIRDYVILRSGTKIGDNCLIKSGAIIGEEGFGFAFDENQVPVKMPHSGGVYIENNVEVGANTVISRGVLQNTIIKKFTIINDLVKIAHNVEIGEKCVIVGDRINGSAVIGNKCWISPGSIIRNKVRIGDNTLIGMGSIVTKDIPEGVMAYGNPAKVTGKRPRGFN